MTEALQWLNVQAHWLLGARAAEWMAAHPRLVAGAALAVAVLLALLLLMWAMRRARRSLLDWRLTLALMGTAQGRRCLRLAREIRTRSRWLRHTIRREVRERVERQALLGLLERFVQQELPEVMERARVFISLGDDREEQRLRRRLEEQTRHWAEKTGDPAREALLEAIAVTRQQAEKIGQTNRERSRLIGGLEEVSGALRELEAEFAGLQAARSQTLPELREQLEQLTRHWSFLRAAHRELETREKKPLP